MVATATQTKAPGRGDARQANSNQLGSANSLDGSAIGSSDDRGGHQRQLKRFALEKGVQGLSGIQERGRHGQIHSPQAKPDSAQPGGQAPSNQQHGTQPVRLKNVEELLQSRRTSETHPQTSKTVVVPHVTVQPPVSPVAADRMAPRPDNSVSDKASSPSRVGHAPESVRSGNSHATRKPLSETSVVTGQAALHAAVTNPSPLPNPVSQLQSKGSEQQQPLTAPTSVRAPASATVTSTTPEPAVVSKSRVEPAQGNSASEAVGPTASSSPRSEAARNRPTYEPLTGKDLVPGIISSLPPTLKVFAAEPVVAQPSTIKSALRPAEKLQVSAGSSPALTGAPSLNPAALRPTEISPTDKNRSPDLTITSPPKPQLFKAQPVAAQFTNVDDLIQRITNETGKRNARFFPSSVMSDLRESHFSPEQLQVVRDSPVVREITRGWSQTYKEELEARLGGQNAKAEAISLRRSVESGEIATDDGKANARGALKGNTQQIQDAYREKYGRNLRKDLKDALGVQFSKPEPSEPFSQTAKSRALVDSLE